jgi:hypothetical protein
MFRRSGWSRSGWSRSGWSRSGPRRFGPRRPGSAQPGDGFYELFTRSARNLVTGTDLLAELALPGADVQSVSERLVELEHDSDQITHAI